jgi:hypothetical protein
MMIKLEELGGSVLLVLQKGDQTGGAWRERAAGAAEKRSNWRSLEESLLLVLQKGDQTGGEERAAGAHDRL